MAPLTRMCAAHPGNIPHALHVEYYRHRGLVGQFDCLQRHADIAHGPEHCCLRPRSGHESTSVGPGRDVFARINDVFNHRDSNVSVLGLNAFASPDRSLNGANAVGEHFCGYGAPRGIWIRLVIRGCR